MAIIYPASCKGMTSGAMRQIKTQGFTLNTTDGGAFAVDFIKKLALNDRHFLLTSREPMGKYMTALEQAHKETEELTAAIQKQTREMVDSAAAGAKAMAEVSGKLRDSAEKMGTAMTKFANIANNAKFAETAKQAESLVNSLERLAELQRCGLLDKVMQAMKQG